MAKGIGLIGNFKGKVGNTVGYKLSASNTGNTQGIRVYQPIVRNPKTSAQAEQRAKLAPINATYRALKMVIDRGNEGLPYGNKSRLAWLKQAFKAEHMPWYEKGAIVGYPVACQVTKGSLTGIDSQIDGGVLSLVCNGVKSETALNTIGAVSAALMAGYTTLKEGDQVTFVAVSSIHGTLTSEIFSIVINTASTEATTKFSASADSIDVSFNMGAVFGTIIVSREGANGEHLRSTAALQYEDNIVNAAPYDAASKAAAVSSYQSSASGYADWAEESIQ